MQNLKKKKEETSVTETLIIGPTCPWGIESSVVINKKRCL